MHLKTNKKWLILGNKLIFTDYHLLPFFRFKFKFFIPSDKNGTQEMILFNVVVNIFYQVSYPFFRFRFFKALTEIESHTAKWNDWLSLHNALA